MSGYNPKNPDAFDQEELAPMPPPLSFLNFVEAPSGSILDDGDFQSPNFRTGISGWRIRADGSVEFGDGVFRGDITGATGTFTGTVNIGSINIPGTTSSSSFHVSSLGNSWWGNNEPDGYADAPAYVLADGTAVFNNATVTGTLIASAATPYIGIIRTAAETITAGQAVSVGPYQTDGGILYDTTGNVSASNSTSITIGANSNRQLVVGIVSGTNTVTGVTYNSVAMTQIEGFSYNAGNKHQYIFILPAPSTGANTLTITMSSGTCNGFTYYSIYNASQSTSPDNHSNGTGIDPSASIATVAAGCMGFGWADGGFIESAVSGTARYEHKLGTGTSPWSGSSGQAPAAGNTVSIAESTSGNQSGVSVITIAPITSVLSRMYKASAAAATNQYWNKYQPFMGFAASSVTVDNTFGVVIAGISTQSALTFPNNYYLSDTAGAVSTSPGTNTRKAGIGVSATELLVTNIW